MTARIRYVLAFMMRFADDSTGNSSDQNDRPAYDGTSAIIENRDFMPERKSPD